MNPSSPNTDNSQGGPETARNPYAQGNSFDRPGTMKPIMSQPDQPAQPIPQQPIMGRAGGDIVLQPEAPKKSKKPLVLIIIVILVLVGAFAAYVFMNSKSGQNLLGQADASTSFNRYANYLLYGEDSDKPLEGEYDDTATYALYDKINSAEEQDFFEKSQSLLDIFSTNFYKTNQNNEELKKLVDSYIGNFEIIKFDSLNSDLNSEDLNKQYLKNGLNDTQNWINDYYSELTNSNYNNAKQYGNYQVSYWSLTANLLKKAADGGCLQNSVFDAACLNNSVSDEDNNKFAEYQDNVFNSLDAAEKSVIRDCWTIEKALIGERQS